MAIQSYDVNAGDDILAVDHNYLRADLLTNDITIAGVKSFTEGIALGGNETLMWDVILFDLDGTSPDTVGYTIDENKVYALIATGHFLPTTVRATTDRAFSDYIYSSLENDVLFVHYGALYDNTDNAQIIIFYIA